METVDRMEAGPAPAPRRARGRIAALAIVLVPLVALAAGMGLPAGLRAIAAGRPANPHGRFQAECGLCHGAEGWKPAVIAKEFDHAKYGFALQGAHAAAKCASCHETLDFSATKSRCATCHEDPHLGELGLDCARCHGERSFLDRARMRRAHQLTLFPLSGGHATLDCGDCHPPTAQGQQRWVGTRPDCVACHRADYDATSDPAHGPAGFPLDCARCHGPRGWRPATFDHGDTRFPLTGAHRPLPCESCHGDGVYAGKDPACASCHQPEYDATTNPAHGAAGFPLTCESCHNTTTWSGAQFDHAGTRFPLTGAHVPLPCASCHGDGVWAGKDPACASCHRTEYDATVDPAHGAAGFPLTCENCHNTTTWSGARFDHDGPYFPIYSGAHAGQWASCATCHTNPANYAVFTCLSCHPHSDRTKTDGDHSSVSGYAYDSQACFNCHPRGRH